MQNTVFIPVNEHQRLSGYFHGALDKSTASGKKTLVMMLHSFPGGHKGGQNDIFGDLEYQLSLDDQPSLHFDFRGCGESEGAIRDFTLASAAADINAARTWAAKRGYERFIYVGEGLGALIALLNLGDNAAAAVLLWPVLDARTPVLRRLAVEGAAKTGINPAFLSEIETLDPAQWISKIRAPLLIQHGENDKDAPYAQINLFRRYGQRSRRIEITCYEGGEHGLTRLNERQTLFYHVRQFVQKYA